MPATIERVETDKRFRELLAVLLEYERDLDPDLRHGTEPTLPEVQRNYQSPNAAFLAFVDNQVAGCVVALALDDSSIVLQRLYARPSFRSRGVGRALVEAVITHARDRGVRRVVLDTDRERLQAAYRLYLSLGFTPCESFWSVEYRCTEYLQRTL